MKTTTPTSHRRAEAYTAYLNQTTYLPLNCWTSLQGGLATPTDKVSQDCAETTANPDFPPMTEADLDWVERTNPPTQLHLGDTPQTNKADATFWPSTGPPIPPTGGPEQLTSPQGPTQLLDLQTGRTGDPLA